MSKGRLEAFSDGVFAIVITIMVLELKVPHGSDFAALRPLLPVFLTYVLSFVYLAIYWNNHHHLLHTVQRVNGPILWANVHLLFWLSLVPFVTGWMGENHFASLPTALYGCVLLMAAVAYLFLQRAIIAEHGRDSKGKLSIAFYAAAVGLSFVNQWFADCLYALVALMWFIPDRRIERRLAQSR
jgi:TMEM175 potassium channel family protein